MIRECANVMCARYEVWDSRADRPDGWGWLTGRELADRVSAWLDQRARELTEQGYTLTWLDGDLVLYDAARIPVG